MKRNGVINVLRLWLLERFTASKPYKEIVPRNYFHALQMNSFSIEFMYSEEIQSNNLAIGVIALPRDECYDVLDDETMFEIIKDCFAACYGDTVTNSLQIKQCIRGKYVSDSGQVFNQDSLCIILKQCSLAELADLGRVIKNKMGAEMVLIKHQDSHGMYGV